jgi:hypothetical protein
MNAKDDNLRDRAIATLNLHYRLPAKGIPVTQLPVSLSVPGI